MLINAPHPFQTQWWWCRRSAGSLCPGCLWSWSLLWQHRSPASLERHRPICNCTTHHKTTITQTQTLADLMSPAWPAIYSTPGPGRGSWDNDSRQNKSTSLFKVHVTVWARPGQQAGRRPEQRERRCWKQVSAIIPGCGTNECGASVGSITSQCV